MTAPTSNTQMPVIHQQSHIIISSAKQKHSSDTALHRVSPESRRFLSSTGQGRRTLVVLGRPVLPLQNIQSLLQTHSCFRDAAVHHKLAPHKEPYVQHTENTDQEPSSKQQCLPSFDRHAAHVLPVHVIQLKKNFKKSPFWVTNFSLQVLSFFFFFLILSKADPYRYCSQKKRCQIIMHKLS